MNKIVRVYKNLHRDCYSVLTKRRDCDDEPKRWLLYNKHCRNLILTSCKFHVREGGRQRVIKQRKKNVHAYIEGELIFYGCNSKLSSDEAIDFRRFFAKENTKEKISYNPYEDPFFVDKNGNPVYDEQMLYLNDEGVWK